MGWLAVAAGAYPLFEAWRANRRTTLQGALLWAAAAWLSWGFALTNPDNDDLGTLALCLTGCAGIAVLGARRPQVFAWNFVVLGLAGVMILPLLEGMVIRVHSFNVERKIFLGGILLVALGNYAATRFFDAVIAIGAVCALWFWKITCSATAHEPVRNAEMNLLAALVLGAGPWLAWGSRQAIVRDRLDADWLAFRDRFGFVWAARVREQFNAAAKNAGLPIQLGWKGSTKPESDGERALDDANKILKALTKRFERYENEDDAR
jgi:hypothetical protein